MASDMNTGLMDQRGKNFRINGDRLWDSLMEMAKIGPGVAGGNNRQTLTDEDAVGILIRQRLALSLIHISEPTRPY